MERSLEIFNSRNMTVNINLNPQTLVVTVGTAIFITEVLRFV